VTDTIDPPETPKATAGATAKVPWTTRIGLDRFSALYLWAGFMIFFGITEGDLFLSWTTFELVLTDKVIVAILALAFLVPLTAETFDLSIGANMSLALVLVNSLSENNDLPQGFNAAIALLACAAFGFISGFVVVRWRVNSFIATLGMSQIIAAVILYISDNRQITRVLSDAYRDTGRTDLFGLPLYFYFMLVLAVILWYILEHTPVGRYLFATGGNREAARLSGVATDRYIWGSLVASAVIAGFAGIVWSWKVGTFSQTIGPGFLFPAVAAVFFGASQFKGRPNVWGTLVAVYALAFGVKGLQLRFGTNTFWIEPLFEGITLVVAVAIASRQGVVKVRRSQPLPEDADDQEDVEAEVENP